MKVYSIKCPDCNAVLEIEEGREYCFCNYCGAKIFLDDERTKRIRITDDAKIKYIESRERIRLAEMQAKERAEKERQEKLDKDFPKIMLICGLGIVICFLLMILVSVLDKQGII